MLSLPWELMVGLFQILIDGLFVRVVPQGLLVVVREEAGDMY